MKPNNFALLLLLASVCSVIPALAQEAGSSRPVAEPVPIARPAITSTGPSGIITTVAGTGKPGVSGIGGPALKADLLNPESVVVDSKGNFYIASPDTNTVQKVEASSGIISIYAGTGAGGYSGDYGLATEAELAIPLSLAIDSSNNLFIADFYNNVIRRVDAATGKISTVAGDGFIDSQFTGLPECGPLHSGAAATASSLCFPLAIALDESGNLYISDEFPVIHRVDGQSGVMTTVAGVGYQGFSGDGGPATSAAISNAEGIAIDKSGNIFFTDSGNCTIRRIDTKTHVITSLVKGIPTGSRGYSCGLSGDGGPAAKAQIGGAHSILVDSAGNLFFADSSNSLIRVIEAGNGYIYTIAGSVNIEPGTGGIGTDASSAGYSGDGGPATGAELNSPNSIGFGPSGLLYIADTSNSVIRSLTGVNALPSNAPVIAPSGGIVPMPASIKIAPAKAGETVYYTTDGSVPNTSSPKYTAPFTISKTTIVNAFSPGSPNSSTTVAHLFYAPTPELSVNGSNPGNLPVGSILTMTDSDPEATIYYTVADSSNPSSQTEVLKAYTGPITLPADWFAFFANIWTSTKDFTGHIVGTWSQTAVGYYTVVPRPVPTTIAASAIAKNSALLNGSISAASIGGTAIYYQFVWGPASSPKAFTTALEFTDASISDSATVSIPISGLSPSTKYAFQLQAQDSITSPSFVDGKALTFTTPAD